MVGKRWRRSARFSVTPQASKSIRRGGVPRQSLSELLNGRNGVSGKMATRLEKAGWSNAEACSTCRARRMFGRRSGVALMNTVPGKRDLDRHGRLMQHCAGHDENG
jgi:hypothetical protein